MTYTHQFVGARCEEATAKKKGAVPPLPGEIPHCNRTVISQKWTPDLSLGQLPTYSEVSLLRNSSHNYPMADQRPQSSTPGDSDIRPTKTQGRKRKRVSVACRSCRVRKSRVCYTIAIYSRVDG